MGNSQPIQSTKFAAINMRKGEANGESFEEKSVSYNVDDRTANVSVKKTRRSTGSNPAEKFIISVTDSDKLNFLSWRSVWPYRFTMMVERVHGQNQHVKVSYAKTCVIQDKDLYRMMVPLYNKVRIAFTPPPLNLYEQDATKNAKITNTAGGGITETSLNPYRVRGCDKQRGLVVIQWKKREWDQNPYLVIVSHYFATLHKTNTGYSVMATIQGDGEDGLQVEGPIFHPATSLFEMFDQVSRTGCWTPNMCPHCATHNHDYSHYYANANATNNIQTANQMQPWFNSIINNNGPAL